MRPLLQIVVAQLVRHASGSTSGALAVALCSVIGALACPAQANDTRLDRMPAELEAKFALSALPSQLRAAATVYVLDPAKGYERFQNGQSGVTCLVERTVWEMADFRNDVYIPLCYDAAGTSTYLKVKMDAAALRADGMDPAELKKTIEGRFRDKTYRVPEKPGLSYMLSPIQRTVGPPNMAVVTLSMPHIMPYAPFVTNEDIGAHPDLHNPASLRAPFIDRQGIDEQSYLIQLAGEKEKAEILLSEKALIEDLCRYRDVLCLP